MSRTKAECLDAAAEIYAGILADPSRAAELKAAEKRFVEQQRLEAQRAKASA